MAACSKNKFEVPDPRGIPVFRAGAGGPGSRSKLFLPPLICSLAALTACRNQDFPQYPPNYREYAYITNGDSGTVTVLDAVNVRVDREIPVGQNPVAVSASPTRSEGYVVNSGAESGQGAISVIDAEKNSVAA